MWVGCRYRRRWGSPGCSSSAGAKIALSHSVTHPLGRRNRDEICWWRPGSMGDVGAGQPTQLQAWRCLAAGAREKPEARGQNSNIKHKSSTKEVVPCVCACISSLGQFRWGTSSSEWSDKGTDGQTMKGTGQSTGVTCSDNCKQPCGNSACGCACARRS